MMNDGDVDLEKKKIKKNYLPVIGLEPGPFWWQAVTLTIRLTGLLG